MIPLIERKDYWQRLHENRTTEVNNLWQRSIFLGTFICLALTGYAIFLKEAFLKIEYKVDGDCLHLLGAGLGIILTTLGILWVMMAKGSKYWQELYERKIDILERRIIFNDWVYSNILYSDVDCREDWGINDGGKNKSIKHFIPFYSLNASRYSPSKINIFLGWFVVLIGTIVSFMHLLFLFKPFLDLFNIGEGILLIGGGIEFAVLVLLLLILHKFCKGGKKS